MEFLTIKTEEQWEEWLDARLRYDHDFVPDVREALPLTIVWIDTESNGYPDIWYDILDVERLTRLLKEQNG
jgi:hypothetical protein